MTSDTRLASLLTEMREETCAWGDIQCCEQIRQWADRVEALLAAQRSETGDVAMSDPQRLKDIQAREQQATPGPWTRTLYRVVDRFGRICNLEGTRSVEKAEAVNAEFIAHAREDIPYLLSLVHAQAQQIEALQGELRQIDQVLARRPAVATEPTRASAVEKACFVAGQQSDRANRLEHEVERLKRQIVPLPDPPVASPPFDALRPDREQKEETKS